MTIYRFANLKNRLESFDKFPKCLSAQTSAGIFLNALRYCAALLLIMACASSGKANAELGAFELKEALRRGSEAGTIVFDGGAFEVLYGDPPLVIGRGDITADLKRIYVRFGQSVGGADEEYLYFHCDVRNDCLVIYPPLEGRKPVAFRIAGKPEPGPFHGKFTPARDSDLNYWYEGFGVKIKIRRESRGFDPVLVREEEINPRYVMVTYAGREDEGTYVLVDTHYSFVIDRRKKTVWGPHHRNYYDSHMFDHDYLYEEMKPGQETDWWPAPYFYGEKPENQDEEYDDSSWQPKWLIGPESISFLGSESSTDHPESLDIRE
jgi:hypothetical protein